MPGLLLSDAALTASSLEGLKFSRTQLVVLSACDTEVGALGSVAAADSLVGYFVRAGVPRVVASRWNVDSALTSLCATGRVYLHRIARPELLVPKNGHLTRFSRRRTNFDAEAVRRNTI